ncbi:hypothetical protein CSO01_25540 [Cellulomonas soli]|uniref:Uncharacterized protein n=1 Tax=Cellulomonas soli TaxID=931535 RepID=A0A512PF63_9CELL|nr:hypothetical protein CSO01_25540 [Cellulomonas soli]
MPDDISARERELLIDCLTDDVSLEWVLIDLGIRVNPPVTPNWRPSSANLDEAFSILARLVDLGLVAVGRMEYIDEGPAGRVAPVRHVTEPLDVVRARVDDAVASAAQGSDVDWAYACWVVSTPAGDRRTREFDSLPSGATPKVGSGRG